MGSNGQETRALHRDEVTVAYSKYGWCTLAGIYKGQKSCQLGNQMVDLFLLSLLDVLEYRQDHAARRSIQGAAKSWGSKIGKALPWQ
jgi:hypothetical protein